MDNVKRLTVYMAQRNWPYKTGDPTKGGDLWMAWFGMTHRQRRRYYKKMDKAQKAWIDKECCIYGTCRQCRNREG